METAIFTHKFEIAGLGKYPFRCTAIVERSAPNGDGTSHPSGTCDYCGNCIKYCCVIESADGKRFEVGSDCVRKSNDRGLVNMVKRAKQAARAAQQRAEWEAKRNTPEAIAGRARIEAERAAQQAQIADEHAQIAANQAWLIGALNNQPGDFCRSMARELAGRRFCDLSQRCRDIIADIYCKQFGRYNSKAYWAAMDELEAKINGGQDVEKAA